MEKLETLKAYYQAENNSQQAAEDENYYFFTWGQICAINSALETLKETEARPAAPGNRSGGC